MRIAAILMLAVAAATVAQGQTLFDVTMDGAQAGTGSAFTGSGTVTLNGAQTQITVALTHDIPSGNVLNGHIHQAPVDVNGGVVFPFTGLGVSPINQVINVSPAQVAVLLAEGYYVNIHTLAFGAGEIRGQIVNPPDPEPTPLGSWRIALPLGVIAVISASLISRRVLIPRARS